MSKDCEEEKSLTVSPESIVIFRAMKRRSTCYRSAFFVFKCLGTRW
jgi:hypothetical protein